MGRQHVQLAVGVTVGDRSSPKYRNGRTSPTGNSGDQPIMNQPVTFQANGTFTHQPPAPAVDTEYITV
jgi:hypothetical protein